MKNSSKYSVVIVIALLLIILSTITTTINYLVSKNSAQEQLRNQALPLSLDNVYTEIQKHIIQPYLVSSMMANDTFVQDWLINNEKNEHKIKQYLSVIKNKYEMFTTFLVSDRTKNYYTQDGFIEKVKKGNINNNWYFKFKQSASKDEINLDYNKNLANSMIMFINYKIFDRDYKYLGATGVGIKISYIDDLLEMFKEKYKFNVIFFNEDGNIVLSKSKNKDITNISQLPYLSNYKNKVLSKFSNFFEIKKNNETYLINTKYISELNLYLLVDAKLSDFIKDVRHAYLINLFISIVIALIITGIIIYIIQKYNKKLEFLADYDQLTKIMNRRTFKKRLEFTLLLSKRNKQKICLAFVDIDNFKNINDTYGHSVGDKVLERISAIMKSSIRKSDLVARWGGEEFVIAVTNSDLENASKVLENIKNSIYTDSKINNFVSKEVTLSIGITLFNKDDNFEELMQRADESMYKAKNSGKNKIVIS
ncbi:MAG: diguanylate cyclase [Halarcobacter sp.]